MTPVAWENALQFKGESVEALMLRVQKSREMREIVNDIPDRRAQELVDRLFYEDEHPDSIRSAMGINQLEYDVLLRRGLNSVKAGLRSKSKLRDARRALRLVGEDPQRAAA